MMPNWYAKNKEIKPEAPSVLIWHHDRNESWAITNELASSIFSLQSSPVEIYSYPQHCEKRTKIAIFCNLGSIFFSFFTRFTDG